MPKNEKSFVDITRINAITALLAQLRENKGLKQRDIADYLHMSVGTISHYEMGITLPPIEVVIQLADFYNVSADYILCRCKNKSDYTKFIDTKLNKGISIGDAVEIMEKASRANKETLAQILKLMAVDLNNFNQK